MAATTLTRTWIATALVAIGLSACSSGGDDNTGGRETGLNPPGSSEPFSGTVYPEPDLLTADSPTQFTTLADRGRGTRSVLDLRRQGFGEIEAFLFEASYQSGFDIEFAVNPEFGTAARARAEAEFYARSIGQLPAVLRNGVARVWVHDGDELWGGAGSSLIIHSGARAGYEAGGIVEETLLHESVHLAIDPLYADDPDWRAARTADDGFISTYARENAAREDFAETFPMWLVARQLPDVGTAETVARTEAAIPNRLDWFDQRGFDLTPLLP